MTLPQPSEYPTALQLATAIRSEILLLIAGGVIPNEEATNFSRLHEFVDANMLGDQLWPEVDWDAVTDEEAEIHSQRMQSILVDAQEQVNIWLLRR